MYEKANRLRARDVLRLPRSADHSLPLAVRVACPMKALRHPIIFTRLVRYHWFSGVTFSNAVKSALHNLNRSV